MFGSDLTRSRLGKKAYLFGILLLGIWSTLEMGLSVKRDFRWGWRNSHKFVGFWKNVAFSEEAIVGGLKNWANNEEKWKSYWTMVDI